MLTKCLLTIPSWVQQQCIFPNQPYSFSYQETLLYCQHNSLFTQSAAAHVIGVTVSRYT